MKTMSKRSITVSTSRQRKLMLGFSLVELMVAMGMFLVVGGAAISLMKRHTSLFGSQQNQVGLNLAMRNAVTQMQNDVENAGTGYYQGVNLPSWPVGVTIVNSPAGTSCYDPATHTYGATCFDKLNIIAVDQSTPPSNPLNVPASSCQSETSSILPVVPEPVPPPGTTVSNNQLASDFHTGDQVLIVSNTTDGVFMVSTQITKDGASNGGKVDLQHNPTGTGTDPLGINGPDPLNNNKLLHKFCSDAVVLRISAISYFVDATDPTNPKLIRQSNGKNDVVAEQIIGFKVGAWNDTTRSYSYDGANTDPTIGYNNDWTTIRAVRISLIGRSGPLGDQTFQNTFDHGNYLVESAAVVVNPRNMSMNH
jgi:type II secretory pathway pseudopilin PulG